MKKILLVVVVVLTLALSGCGNKEQTVIDCSKESLSDVVLKLVQENDSEYLTDNCKIQIVKDRIIFTEYNESGEVYNTDWYSIDKILNK